MNNPKSPSGMAKNSGEYRAFSWLMFGSDLTICQSALSSIWGCAQRIIGKTPR
ncbi:Hypothetical protein FKW44_002104, partial [Caligus rogercresseyi]